MSGHSGLGDWRVFKIFDAEVIIYDYGFTQRRGTAEVETQCLYHAEMRIITESVEFKEGTTRGGREGEREKKTRQKRTERKQRETDRV